MLALSAILLAVLSFKPSRLSVLSVVAVLLVSSESSGPTSLKRTLWFRLGLGDGWVSGFLSGEELTNTPVTCVSWPSENCFSTDGVCGANSESQPGVPGVGVSWLSVGSFGVVDWGWGMSCGGLPGPLNDTPGVRMSWLSVGGFNPDCVGNPTPESLFE